MQHFQKRKEWKGRGNGWERRLEVRVWQGRREEKREENFVEMCNKILQYNHERHEFHPLSNWSIFNAFQRIQMPRYTNGSRSVTFRGQEKEWVFGLLLQSQWWMTTLKPLAALCDATAAETSTIYRTDKENIANSINDDHHQPNIV
jgi:hypothetical protein